MANRLKGKVAIVTGAASGIGEAIITLFAKEGAEVVVNDINKELGQAVVKKIKDQRGKATFVYADVSKLEDVENLIKTTVKTYGKLTTIVNNAAIVVTGKCADISPADWRKGLAVVLDGVFYMCKYALPEMLKATGGSIVNIASISGMAADYAFTNYNAAKAGVINLTHAIAIDYARQGIRCNCISPGIILTPLTKELLAADARLEPNIKRNYPMGRLGKPEEIANCALFLASDESSIVNGCNLVADGGMMAYVGQPNYINIEEYISWGEAK